MRKYKVIDWAGNDMNFGTFKTFEDAWDFIFNRFPNDDDCQEFEVVTVQGLISV